MKVTIMITSYNLVDCIDRAIESVIQMEKPFEWTLLVGDDGSTDGTIGLIEQWIKKYPVNIQLFTSSRSDNVKSGKRAAKNRARLLEKADGDYLIFLDGDDEFIGTDKLKTQVSFLESDTYHHCAGCAHNIIANQIAEGKTFPLVDCSIPLRTYTAKEYWPGMYFHTDTILFRKECKELMLKPEYKDSLNDNFITYCILQYGDLLYLPESYAQYNLTGNGLWTGNKKVYGCFRNMMAYDLELRINSALIKESFIRHLYDFTVIFKYYSINEKELIAGLLEGEPQDLYPNTFLLYNCYSMTFDQRLARFRLRLKTIIVKNKLRISRLLKKFSK